MGWTEHDLAQIEKRDGYRINHQVGATQGASAPEILLEMMLDAHDVDGFEREVMLVPGRKWRYDFVHEAAKLVVEIEGVTHDGGRHQRVAGFEADCEKYEAAMLRGYRVYRCTPRRVKSGAAVHAIIKLLDQ